MLNKYTTPHTTHLVPGIPRHDLLPCKTLRPDLRLGRTELLVAHFRKTPAPNMAGGVAKDLCLHQIKLVLSVSPTRRVF